MYFEPEAGKPKENEDLARFIRLYNFESPTRGDVPLHVWDQRADVWDTSFHEDDDKKRSTEARVKATVDFLHSFGALSANSVVVDAGCGVGHYAAALANEVKEVLAIDISSQMIEHAKARAAELDRTNISFLTRDFHTIDVDKEGFSRKFDLVFASLSPASNGVEGLEKLMAMSRKWCFVSTTAGQTNSLNARIANEVFHVDTPLGRDTRRMYALFNLLYLAGFTPTIYPYRQLKQRSYQAIEEDAHHLAGRVLGYKQADDNNVKAVLSWMKKNANEENLVLETSDHLYAWVLWQVNERTKRRVYPPDFAVE